MHSPMTLQCYAARELDTGATPLDQVLAAPADAWPEKINEIIDGGFSEEAFVRDLQSRMEGVVLNLPNGRALPVDPRLTPV